MCPGPCHTCMFLGERAEGVQGAWGELGEGFQGAWERETPTPNLILNPKPTPPPISS